MTEPAGILQDINLTAQTGSEGQVPAKTSKIILSTTSGIAKIKFPTDTIGISVMTVLIFVLFGQYLS